MFAGSKKMFSIFDQAALPLILVRQQTKWGDSSLKPVIQRDKVGAKDALFANFAVHCIPPFRLRLPYSFP